MFDSVNYCTGDELRLGEGPAKDEGLRVRTKNSLVQKGGFGSSRVILL